MGRGFQGGLLAKNGRVRGLGLVTEGPCPISLWDGALNMIPSARLQRPPAGIFFFGTPFAVLMSCVQAADKKSGPRRLGTCPPRRGSRSIQQRTPGQSLQTTSMNYQTVTILHNGTAVTFTDLAAALSYVRSLGLADFVAIRGATNRTQLSGATRRRVIEQAAATRS